jgi:DNA repair photolyase
MMRKYGHEQNPLHLDEKELRTDLGTGNFIFVCSGCDLFHPDIPDKWIERVADYAKVFDNKYLWHTKNPARFLNWQFSFRKNDVLCVTIETDQILDGISNAPTPGQRIDCLQRFKGNKMITIEPILEFGNPESFARIIRSCHPAQVNIGADSGHNHLPEPSPEKIGELIEALRPYTKIDLKDNLKRLYQENLNNA